jgi:Domain of unknown function (DUF4185)/N-acetylmuramoyl-L-alanine amidase
MLVQDTLWARGPLGAAPRREAAAPGLDLLTAASSRELAVGTAAACPPMEFATAALPAPRAVAAVDDPDGFPIPVGCYWGPLDGPAESWSNLAGTEPPSSKDGLTRWQEAVGISGTGVYDNATKEAAARMQYLHEWRPVTGTVAKREWDEVIHNGWRLPTPEAPAPSPTPKSPNGYQISWYDGPGYDQGHGAYLRIYLHTTESQDWITTADNVAVYQTRTKNDPDLAGSYHYIVDDDHIINTVATKNTAWGLNSDNPVSVHIAMAGTSGITGCWGTRSAREENPNVESQPKTREQWLAHDKMLDMVAFTVATVAKQYDIPIEWLEIGDVGANRSGVSSHYNYSYGSAALYGEQDSNHWDVPPTFPHEVVLDAAKGYAEIIEDPDRFPLPTVHYWGPLSGPARAWSNTHGGEPASSIRGLTRWQETVGIDPSGIYDNATKVAAQRLQQSQDWPVTGHICEREWNHVIRSGWQLPSPEALRAIPPINPGPAVDRPMKIRDVTGPPFTTQFAMEATDLGVMARTPSGRILAVFGDTFREARVGGSDWRAPVALFSDTKNLDDGIVWNEAAGADPNYARQLWPYSHVPYSTVLPSDIMTVGGEMYLHAIANFGDLGNVGFTEIWKSIDDGHTWVRPGPRFAADLHGGLAQLWTWDVGDDGWVYVLSTGFQRDKPLILRRVPADRITDPAAYQGWGNGADGWAWGNEPTSVLDGQFGEMSLRRIQGQWVFVSFDNAGYKLDVRVFSDITSNLYDAQMISPIHGTEWGRESDDAVAQLYGPSIVPGSQLDAGFHILLSQWHTDDPNGWPYHASQFKIPVPGVPLGQGDGEVAARPARRRRAAHSGKAGAATRKTPPKKSARPRTTAAATSVRRNGDDADESSPSPEG